MKRLGELGGGNFLLMKIIVEELSLIHIFKALRVYIISILKCCITVNMTQKYPLYFVIVELYSPIPSPIRLWWNRLPSPTKYVPPYVSHVVGTLVDVDTTIYVRKINRRCWQVCRVCFVCAHYTVHALVHA